MTYNNIRILLLTIYLSLFGNSFSWADDSSVDWLGMANDMAVCAGIAKTVSSITHALEQDNVALLYKEQSNGFIVASAMIVYMNGIIPKFSGVSSGPAPGLKSSER